MTTPGATEAVTSEQALQALLDMFHARPDITAKLGPAEYRVIGQLVMSIRSLLPKEEGK